jgi:hypothetical protein
MVMFNKCLLDKRTTPTPLSEKRAMGNFWAGLEHMDQITTL